MSGMSILVPRDKERHLKRDKAFEKLKSSFAKDLAEKVKALQKAVTGTHPINKTCDWEMVGRIAHQIKGTARSFGYSEISIVADELEQSVGKKSLEYTTGLVRRISDLSRFAP